jgi:hypothetical protein
VVAIFSFALGMAGQVAYHLLAQAGAARAVGASLGFQQPCHLYNPGCGDLADGPTYAQARIGSID